jgi:hypothetical protein
LANRPYSDVAAPVKVAADEIMLPVAYAEADYFIAWHIKPGVTDQGAVSVS